MKILEERHLYEINTSQLKSSLSQKSSEAADLAKREKEVIRQLQIQQKEVVRQATLIGMLNAKVRLCCIYRLHEFVFFIWATLV